jgi:hypothetical protein
MGFVQATHLLLVSTVHAVRYCPTGHGSVPQRTQELALV